MCVCANLARYIKSVINYNFIKNEVQAQMGHLYYVLFPRSRAHLRTRAEKGYENHELKSEATWTPVMWTTRWSHQLAQPLAEQLFGFWRKENLFSLRAQSLFDLQHPSGWPHTEKYVNNAKWSWWILKLKVEVTRSLGVNKRLRGRGVQEEIKGAVGSKDY